MVLNPVNPMLPQKMSVNSIKNQIIGKPTTPIEFPIFIGSHTVIIQQLNTPKNKKLANILVLLSFSKIELFIPDVGAYFFKQKQSVRTGKQSKE